MIYNVLAGVVALIDADDESAAKGELGRRLRAAGFDVYDGQPLDAFESDDQSAQVGAWLPSRVGNPYEMAYVPTPA